MNFDLYNLRARYIPTVLTALPLIVFSGFIKDEVWLSMFSNVNNFIIVENISITSIFIAGLIFFQRSIGKHVFEDIYFDSGKNFPTTILLLHQDRYLSKQKKSKIRDKIFKDYGLKLMNEQDEVQDSGEAKKLIRDSINLIRKAVKNGDKTLQYNINYGFSRNFIAGTIIAIPFSIINIFAYIEENMIPMILSALLCVIYSTALLFSRTIMYHFARAYAECLLTEYLTAEK